MILNEHYEIVPIYIFKIEFAKRTLSSYYWFFACTSSLSYIALLIIPENYLYLNIENIFDKHFPFTDLCYYVH